jgi:hypothetical protein
MKVSKKLKKQNMKTRNLSMIETMAKTIFAIFAGSILALTFGCSDDPTEETSLPTI